MKIEGTVDVKISIQTTVKYLHLETSYQHMEMSNQHVSYIQSGMGIRRASKWQGQQKNMITA